MEKIQVIVLPVQTEFKSFYSLFLTLLINCFKQNKLIFYYNIVFAIAGKHNSYWCNIWLEKIMNLNLN